MAKFEKLGLRWGHLMWPESVTFSSRSIKFSGDLYKWWRNSYTKFGAAARRRFFAILKKPQGADTRPPAGARVKRFMTENRKDQNLSVYTLMCRGNYQYNQRIASEDISGEPIVLKRPHTDTPAERFAPCHACLGYVLKTDLWRHIKRCPNASEKTVRLIT